MNHIFLNKNNANNESYFRNLKIERKLKTILGNNSRNIKIEFLKINNSSMKYNLKYIYIGHIKMLKKNEKRTLKTLAVDS